MNFKGFDKDGLCVYQAQFDYARQSLCGGAVNLYRYHYPEPLVSIGGTPYDREITLTIRNPRECVDTKQIRRVSRWMIEAE